MNNNFDSFRIAMLIKEIYSKAMHIVEENLADSNLTHQQIIVIKLIAHNKEMTISGLCREMSLAKGTVSGIISRLEQCGYLEKFKKENDKRNTYIRFSPKGIEFANNFRGNIQDSFDKIFQDCTQEQMEEFVKSLREILLKMKGC